MNIQMEFNSTAPDNELLTDLSKKYNIGAVNISQGPLHRYAVKTTIPTEISDEQRLNLARFGIEYVGKTGTAVGFSDNTGDLVSLVDIDRSKDVVKENKIDFLAVTLAAFLDPEVTTKNLVAGLDKYAKIAKTDIYSPVI